MNNGRLRPVWSVTPFPGGTLSRQVGQATAALGRCSFRVMTHGRSFVRSTAAGDETRRGGMESSADDRQSRNTSGGAGDRNTDTFIRSTFVVPPHLVRLAMSAKQIGHSMRSSGKRHCSWATAWTSMIHRRRRSGGSWLVVCGAQSKYRIRPWSYRGDPNVAGRRPPRRAGPPAPRRARPMTGGVAARRRRLGLGPEEYPSSLGVRLVGEVDPPGERRVSADLRSTSSGKVTHRGR